MDPIIFVRGATAFQLSIASLTHYRTSRKVAPRGCEKKPNFRAKSRRTLLYSFEIGRVPRGSQASDRLLQKRHASLEWRSEQRSFLPSVVRFVAVILLSVIRFDFEGRKATKSH